MLSQKFVHLSCILFLSTEVGVTDHNEARSSSFHLNKCPAYETHLKAVSPNLHQESEQLTAIDSHNEHSAQSISRGALSYNLQECPAY